MWKPAIGGMALFLAALVGQVSAAPLVSPTAGSDQIRAARTVSAADDLVFTYTRTVTAKGRPVSADTGTVILGADFTAIDQAADHTLDDFALCRVLSWKTGATDVDNQSCFYMPAFRLAELSNRQALNRMLTGAMESKKVPESLAPYWAEQELSVQDAPTDPLKIHTGATTVDYSLNGRVVVRTSLAGTAFAADQRQRVARYLARHVDLHPQVLRAILASGQVPSDIIIERYQADQPNTETLHFTALSHQVRDYPLPPHLTAALVTTAKGDSIEARGLKQALAVMDGTVQPPKPDFETLMGRLEVAVDGKQAMAATLLFQELASEYGGSLLSDATRMARLKAVMPRLQVLFAEPDSARFMQAAELAGDSKATPQNEAAARYLSEAKGLDAMPFGTFRYVTFANLVRASGDISGWDKGIFSAMPALPDCYWTHIAAYPWIGNTYKDMGDLAYGDFQLDKAWQAWDLGRAVDSDWRKDTLQSVAEYEDSLRAALPDDF